MSDFGDFTSDDAFDPVEPEPEPLARFILESEWFLTADPTRKRLLEDLHPWEIALRLFIAARIIQRLRDEGSLG